MTRRRRSVSSPLAGISTLSGAPPGARVGDVVHLAVGDGDRAGQARARDVGQRAVDRAEQARAGVAALRHGDGAQLQVRAASPPAGSMRGARRLGQPRRDRRSASTPSGRPPAGRYRAGCRGSPAPARGPASQSSSTAKPASRQTVPRARRNAASATTSSGDHAERGDQPERQQRLEAQCGDDLLPVLIAPASAGWPARAPGRPCSCRSARTSRG